MKIVLPFPSSLLSGNGSAMGQAQWSKFKAIKQHREWARLATLEAAGPKGTVRVEKAEQADIEITVRFIPPNNRGDRVGYPYRMKAYFDGIADALGVNDRRFHPQYVFLPAEKPGRVEVYIGAGEGLSTLSTGSQPSECVDGVVDKKTASAAATNQRTGHRHNAVEERLP